jgi:ferritin
MPLNSQVAASLNQQINNELGAAYTYLAMASYFDANDMPGFSGWFRAHAQEEIGHAMRIYEFLSKRGARVQLMGVPAPQSNFRNPVEAIATAYGREQEVTLQIHAMFELAHEVKEYGTQNMLHWFLDEQVSEEDTFRRLLTQAEAAGDDKWQIAMLDRQMRGPQA